MELGVESVPRVGWDRGRGDGRLLVIKRVWRVYSRGACFGEKVAGVGVGVHIIQL